MTTPGAIRSLPLTAWAARFGSGRVILCGVLDAAVASEDLRVEPGAVALWLTFVGGAAPRLGRVEIRGPVPGGVAAFEAPRVPSALLDRLLDGLADVTVDAEALPVDDVAFVFASGLEVVLPSGHGLRVSGATEGRSHDPTLCRPIEVAIGGGGLKVSHRSLRWLANQIPVAVTHLRLHPDGRVELRAGGGRLARLVQGGLAVAGEQLTELVRTAPALERVRAFLRTG